jgi:hypothetical protein
MIENQGISLEQGRLVNTAETVVELTPSFAKLQAENGKTFNFTHVNDLTGDKKPPVCHAIYADIGREKRDGDLNYFNLSESNTMSKRHARIFWDPVHEGFYIQNLSKNKITVDCDEVSLGQEP